MKLDELNVYKLASEIGDDAWLMVEKWSFFEKDTIGKQLVRAADSISANIAEGFGRYFYTALFVITPLMGVLVGVVGSAYLIHCGIAWVGTKLELERRMTE